MELKLKPAASIKIIHESNEYTVRKATMEQAIQLEKSIEESKKGKKSPHEVTVEFLCAAGLPREMIMTLDLDAVNEVVAVLMPTQKKT